MGHEDRVERILERLTERSEAGKHEWGPEAEPELMAFWTLLGDWSIRIMSIDRDGEHPYAFSIFGKDQDHGPEMERIGSTLPPRNDHDKEVNRNLARLFEVARSSALGIDKALSGLESLLDQD